MISLKSQITRQILNYYFLNPQASHYINELARILKLDPKNVDRKLKELEKVGILKSEFLGKQRYFSLARNSPRAKTYRQLFLQTYGLENELRQILKKIKGLKEAYIFGSYAGSKLDQGSDIDVLAVGEHKALELQKEVNQIQKKSGREINIVNMSRREFERKKVNRDPFIRNIFSRKFIKLI